MDTSPGDITAQDFGPYRIVRRLGLGGMAETFEAIRYGRSGFSQHVCLKLVRPAFREDAISIQLFEREARLAAKLHHSNIVGVIDFGEVEGTLYMALELVEGVDLRKLLDARRKLSPAHVALLGYELAAAVEHAHNPTASKGTDGLGAGGILHRDISPSNVLISRYGEIKLTDFGLANVAVEGSRQSTVKGKFPYMAPERLRDEPLDARSDLFSLGVVLYEALAGRRPYEGAHDPATIMLIVEGDHPALRELAPDTPEGLCAIVERLIAPHRERRPPSAGALVEQLEAFVPPPNARRKLGKMVVATPGYMARGADRSVEPSPAPSVHISSGAEEPQSNHWSRRELGKKASWLLLALGGTAGAFALWSRRKGQTPPEETEEKNSLSGVVSSANRGVDTTVQTIAPNPADASVASAAARRSESSGDATSPAAAPAAPAHLTVLVSPWGNVWINGKPQGAAPLKRATLKPGRYKISAGQGEPTASRTIRLRAGDRKTIRFDLVE
ncbi:MAG: serine/threonine-protein kinase [Polyangiales bacterium]